MHRIAFTPGAVARLAGLLLLVGGALYVLLREPARPGLERAEVVRPAKTFVVETAGRIASRSYSGVVKATDLVDLAFRVSGPLVQLPVRRGEEVESGAVLAQIDPRDFQTRLARVTSQLEQAQAQLKAMKAGEREEVIRRLENELAAAKADLANAKVELERAQKLLDDRVLSQSDFDQAKLRRDVAAEAVQAAEQSLQQARKGARAEDVEAQEATIRGLEAQQKEAEDALRDTTLTAPYAGVVAKLFVENFETVRGQQPILSLQDISTVDIVADVPESLLVVIRREFVQKLEVELEALPGRRFDVEFKEIETEADRRTQTYAVAVSMPAPEDVRILPGMAATLHLTLAPEYAAQAGGVPVPVTAVASDEPGEAWVWRVAPDTLTVHKVPVEVGEPTGDQILVTSGLEDGTEIVTAGVHFLREGMRIRRLEASR